MSGVSKHYLTNVHGKYFIDKASIDPLNTLCRNIITSYTNNPSMTARLLMLQKFEASTQAPMAWRKRLLMLWSFARNNCKTHKLGDFAILTEYRVRKGGSFRRMCAFKRVAQDFRPFKGIKVAREVAPAAPGIPTGRAGGVRFEPRRTPAARFGEGNPFLARPQLTPRQREAQIRRTAENINNQLRERIVPPAPARPVRLTFNTLAEEAADQWQVFNTPPAQGAVAPPRWAFIDDIPEPTT